MDLRGHRVVPHAADCVIEAWAPDRCTCLTEAMAALVDVFATSPDDAVARAVPLSAEAGPDVDILVTLLEQVLAVTDVLDAVPVRFHLSDTEEGGVAGDMEVIDAARAELVGPVPKAVSHRGLSMAGHAGTWSCRAVVEV